MSDIVEQLRKCVAFWNDGHFPAERAAMTEAADEIERLRGGLQEYIDKMAATRKANDQKWPFYTVEVELCALLSPECDE